MQTCRHGTMIATRHGRIRTRFSQRRCLDAVNHDEPEPDETKSCRGNENPESSSLFSQVEAIIHRSKSTSRDVPSLPKPKRSKKLLFPHSQTTTRLTRDTKMNESQTISLKPRERPKSLFESFGIQEPTTEILISDVFKSDSYQRYSEILDSIIQDDTRFLRPKSILETPVKLEPIRNWLKSREPTVLCHVPSLDFTVDRDSSQIPGNLALTNEILNQRRLFMEHNAFSQEEYKIALRGLAHVANVCAKQMEGKPTELIWRKMKEAGYFDQKLLHTLLYLSANFSSTSQRNLIGPSILDALEPKRAESTANERTVLAGLVDEIAAFHDLLYKPTEQTINIKVRLLVAQTRPHEAEELLEKHLEDANLRLRSFSPIFRLYLEQDDVGSALRLFHKMLSISPVHLDTDTYVSLLSSLAENGCFHPLAPPISSAEQLGYSSSSGPGLFNEIVSVMAKDKTDVPLASAKRLYNAFAVGFPEFGFKKTASFAPLQIVSNRASSYELILNRVQIDPSIGECFRSGVKLRLIQLEDDESEALKQGIVSLARSMQLTFQQTVKATAGKSLPQDERADENLLKFYDWLDAREGDPFTAIVDGANVGYYMQNFEHGRFSYHQIQFVVDHLERSGETPLVVLPSKYARSSFYVTIGAGGSMGSRMQELTPDERRIRDSLIKSGKVSVVPRGFLDDFYWILASLSRQTKARNGKDLFVPPDSPDGRWPGGRPVLISNDQMRDHKVGMLEPRLFRRWYSNFIVNYDFAGFVGNSCMGAAINFSPADFFSREIQCNASDSSMAWHFPISDTDDEWFCIRIPLKLKRHV